MHKHLDFKSLAATFVVACVLGSFMAGFIYCSDCNSIMERYFIGMIWIVIAPLYLGIVPENEGGGGPFTNVWYLIIPIWMILVPFAAYRRKKRGNKQ